MFRLAERTGARNVIGILLVARLFTRQVTPRNPAGMSRQGRRRILTTVEIGQSDVAARESRPANPARGCLLPSCAPKFHYRERTRSGAPNLSALDDWATSNRVHAMYFTRLVNNNCGKGELINWRDSVGSHPSGSSKLDRNGALDPDQPRRLATACHSHRATQKNTTGSLAEYEPTDSEHGLGMFGRQEGSEGS